METRLKKPTEMTPDELDQYLEEQLNAKNIVGGIPSDKLAEAINKRAQALKSNPKFQSAEAQKVLSTSFSEANASKLKERFTPSFDDAPITVVGTGEFVNGNKPAPDKPKPQKRDSITIPEDFGWLAKTYESKGDSSAIGYDKLGGASYGILQMSSKQGVVQKFVDTLKNKLPYSYRVLSKALSSVGEGADGLFGKVWKSQAELQEFQRAEMDFLKKEYLLPRLKEVEKEGLLQRFSNPILLETLFSTSIQHGNNTFKIIKKALSDDEKMTDERFATRLYNIRKTLFGRSSKEVRKSVQVRLEEEKQEVLKVLRGQNG